MPPPPMLWWKTTLGTILSSGVGADLETMSDKLDTALSPVLTTLAAIADALSQVSAILVQMTGINYTQTVAALLKQIRDEYLLTGLSLLPMWDHALDDYLYHLRTGRRLCEDVGYPNTYAHFVGRIAGSFSDTGDSERPVTTGPIAVFGCMVAAPTLSDFLAVYAAVLNLFRTDDIRAIYDRLQALAPGGAPEPVTYSIPPDWKGAHLQDVFPDMAAVMITETDKIIDTLYQHAYIEDALKEGSALLLAKIARLTQALAGIVQYVKNLQQVLEMGGYFFYVESGQGVDDIRSRLLACPRPGDFTDDMFIAGFAASAAGPNIYSFERLFGKAKKP